MPRHLKRTTQGTATHNEYYFVSLLLYNTLYLGTGARTLPVSPANHATPRYLVTSLPIAVHQKREPRVVCFTVNMKWFLLAWALSGSIHFIIFMKPVVALGTDWQ